MGRFRVGEFRAAGHQQLGDAEIEQFRRPVTVDQDVSGLEIAVHDEVAVREVDGFADGQNQADSVFDAQGPLGGVAGDPGAFDELHDEPGDAVFGGATVEQAGDVGVFEAGEDLAFAAEAAEDEIGVEAGAHQFDGDFGFVLIVGANGEIDGAHASGADFADEPVGADAAPFHAGLPRDVAGDGENGAVDFGDDKALGDAVAFEKGGDLGEQFPVAGAGFFEPAGKGFRRLVESAAEDVLDPFPAFRFRRQSQAPTFLAATSRWSQATAVRCSRTTVAEEIPRAWATSSRSKPPK